ncbi:MAG TPA: hypothetical protein VNN77_01030 [candidate division Zixibacteria bacterium]|nr:hypothetical protein [candidate division Zixibacteria bacterium]
MRHELYKGYHITVTARFIDEHKLWTAMVTLYSPGNVFKRLYNPDERFGDPDEAERRGLEAARAWIDSQS